MGRPRPTAKPGNGGDGGGSSGGDDERRTCYKTCKSNGKTNKQCRDECSKKGQPGGGDGGNGGKRPGESDDTKMRREIGEDAALAVADAMKTCREGGKSFKECQSDDAVRTALAEAMGKTKAQIKPGMVKEFAYRAAKILAPRLIAKCKEDGGADCAQTVATQMKKLLGSSFDKTKAEKFMTEGAQEEVYKILRECAPADMATCRQTARERLAELMGVDVSKIKPSKLKEFERAAAGRMLMQAIKSCKEDDELTQVEKKECLKEAQSVLKDPAKDANAEPKGREVQMALRRAGATAMREAMEECEPGDEAACRAAARENLKMFMGEDVTDVEVGQVRNLAAMNAAADQIKACMAAGLQGSETSDERKAVLDACKTQMREAFEEIGAGGNAAGGELDKEVAKIILMRERETCMQEATKEAVKSCITSLAEDSKELLRDLDKGSGSAKKRQNRLKRVQKEATRKVIGRAFFACLKAEKETKEEAGGEFTESDREAAKTKCKEEAKELREKTTEEKLSHVLARAAAAKVASAMTECDGTFKDCMKEVKAMIKDLGLGGPREFRKFVRLGLTNLLGEWMAACQDEGKTREVCIEEAKTRFKTKFNADDAAFQALVEKIKAMAKNMRDGVETELVEKPEIDVELAAGEDSVCDTAKFDALRNELAEAMKTAVTEKPVGGDWSADDLDKVSCSVSELRARYGFKVNLDEASKSALKSKAEEIAEEIYAHYKSKTEADRRRLSEMDSIDEVYASQTVDEQAVNQDPVFTDGAVGASVGVAAMLVALVALGAP